MRRKDLKYYKKTLHLKWNAYQLYRQSKSSTFRSNIKNRRNEYLKKWNLTTFEIQPFSFYYTTYFYLKTTDIFNGPYNMDKGFPTSLKSNSAANPLFPIYFGLVDLNCNDFNEALHADISSYINDKSKVNSGGTRLEYAFDYDLFDLKSPWVSGITQSLGASYFLRQYYKTRIDDYLNTAESLFSICLQSVEFMGLLRSTKDGFEWVEEYPNAKGSYVLNGHMFAIIASIELYQITEKEIYKHTSEQWIRSLLFHLPEYQFKHYLLHNKHQNKLSNIEYQGLYVGLFKHLYELTKHPLFMEFYHFYNSELDWNFFNRFYGMENS